STAERQPSRPRSPPCAPTSRPRRMICANVCSWHPSRRKPWSPTGRSWRPSARPTRSPLNGEAEPESRREATVTTDIKKWNLRLYVAGQTPKSLTALANLKRICDEHMNGQYAIEIIDLMENPQLAQR